MSERGSEEQGRKVTEDDVDAFVARLEYWGTRLPASEQMLLRLMVEQGMREEARESLSLEDAPHLPARVAQLASAILKELVKKGLGVGYWAQEGGWGESAPGPWGQAEPEWGQAWGEAAAPFDRSISERGINR
jgi:hypothetical protein